VTDSGHRPRSGNDPDIHPPSASPDDDERPPLWVRVFGIAALVLILIVVIVHLAGGGFHGHTMQ